MQSAKALFRATKRRRPPAAADALPHLALPDQRAPDAPRDPLDYDPTPPDATAAFLALEADRIARFGRKVWEPAVGGGHMARVLDAAGFEVIGSDIRDRGHPGTLVRDFYDWQAAPARSLVTNPPYNEINARDGHGRWLKHAFGLGLDYIALLLNADWPAARVNGMDALFEHRPPSIEYLCCWKIDFRGGGSPPQRNSWFVWDRTRPGPGAGRWVRARLYRDAASRQEALL